MPRPARPWFRKSHMSFFGSVGGKPTNLHVKDPSAFDEAFAVLNRLRAQFEQPPDIPDPPPTVATVTSQPDPTVAEAVDAFLAKRKPKISPGCWSTYDTALRVHFVPAFGPRAVKSLTAEEIEEWADRPRQWSNSTAHDYLGTVQQLLKFAKCPLSIKRPPKESRGAEAVLSDTQFEIIVSNAGEGDFPQMLRVIRETGARPQEIAGLTVEAMDWEHTCFRTKAHKGRRHGTERVIHFNAAAMRVLNVQRESHATGLLFRTKLGTRFGKDCIVHRMARISKRAGIHATAYMGRHSFATAALVAGIPDAVVAELLGHRGTAMVAKHYGHVSGQARVLKDAVERIRQPRAG